MATTPAVRPVGIRAPSRATVARVAGALLLLAVGIDHIDQYYADSYSTVPTIGTLFALNFASAALVALGLLVPIGRVAGRRAAAVRSLLAAGGIAIAAATLAGLLISENGGLFGFAEHGYRSEIVLSIVLEVATVACLGVFLAVAHPKTREDAS